jgi:hypothetical protein
MNHDPGDLFYDILDKIENFVDNDKHLVQQIQGRVSQMFLPQFSLYSTDNRDDGTLYRYRGHLLGETVIINFLIQHNKLMRLSIKFDMFRYFLQRDRLLLKAKRTYVGGGPYEPSLDMVLDENTYKYIFRALPVTYTDDFDLFIL